MWRIIAEVWVGILAYACVHDDRSGHREFTVRDRAKSHRQEETSQWLSMEEDQTKSFIHNACDLAAKVKSRTHDTGKMWEVITKVIRWTTFKALPMELNEEAESTTDVVLQTVLEANSLLRSSLRLIAGIKHGCGRHSRDFYQRVRQSFLGLRNPRHAIRIVEAELNLIYDSFYTDGTIFFSDWTISSPGEENGSHLLLAFVPHRRRWWSDHDVVSSLAWMHGTARVLFRRWSETISKFNFPAYSIKQPKETQASYIRPEVLTGITGLVRSFKFVSSDWYTDELGVFIFEELKAKRIDVISSLNQKWRDHDNFKKSVLSWHIATELLYNFEDNCEQHQSQDHEYSKLLSDYMAYLFFMKPVLSTG
ncbi:hypothetical protein Cgig2_022078 [Carnegiea gigantea]|uniref:DUF4220 domain-containing protein n=1 Tax=Carnegiea gigantea TaxID=171969 RepID=A0A9Q1KSV3_9CARY|nr:hypothetical protein Cgig2_022078 [Carnegiea gigantea]